MVDTLTARTALLSYTALLTDAFITERLGLAPYAKLHFPLPYWPAVLLCPTLLHPAGRWGNHAHDPPGNVPA